MWSVQQPCRRVVLCAALLLLVGTATRAAPKDKCPSCRTIVTKFKQGIVDTEGGGYGGGNTEWEERALGTYATSETRFHEIAESVCSSSDYTCNSLWEDAEDAVLDDWWPTSFESDAEDLQTFLCIDTLKVCCPSNHYGKDCKPCSPEASKPCNHHGTCQGAGSRTGTGKCQCDRGYKGKNCSKCEKTHFLKMFGKDESAKHFVCEECDASCSGCSGPGANSCKKCKSGYALEGENCTDVDECTGKDAAELCTLGTFCSNTEGGFECEKCDNACDATEGCNKAGPGGCKQCAKGYTNADGQEECTDINECLGESPCEASQYCSNSIGSHECTACHSACESCTGPSDDDCSTCASGFEATAQPEDGAVSCKDIDECAGSPCDADRDCVNTVGSFECNCKAPLQLVDGECRAPDEQSAAGDGTDQPKDEL
eukprot:m.317067 g.317067  ORF g.317067 m.317067 type:complete len:428 (+) comp19683_c0_seq8:297-1580(+)